MPNVIEELAVSLVASTKKLDESIRTGVDHAKRTLAETEKPVSPKANMGDFLRSIADGAKKAGVLIATAAAAATAAVAAIGIASVKAAGDFEAGMREVNTLIGLSQAELDALSGQVNKLARGLGVDATEATKALYQAISAGVPKENALSFLEIASKAAIGGVTNTATAVDGLTTVMNAFKVPMEEAEHVADVMFTTVKQGKTTFAELSGAMFNVAPIAAAAGVKFEEVSAAIASLTKQGVPTSVATTQMRAAIQALIKPSSEATKLAEQLGIAFNADTLRAKGLKGTFDELYTATGGNQEQLATLLGSVEGLGAVLSLTGGNAAMFEGDLEAIAGAAGASNAAFEEMSKGFNFQMDKIGKTLNSLMIELGSKILPAVTPIVAAIGEKLPIAFDIAVLGAQRLAEGLAPVRSIFQGTIARNLRDFMTVLTSSDVQDVAAAFESLPAPLAAVASILDDITHGLDFANLAADIEKVTGLDITAFAGVFNQAAAGAGRFADIITQLGSAVGSAIGPAVETILPDLISIWNQLTAAFAEGTPLMESLNQLMTELGPVLELVGIVIGGIVVANIGLWLGALGALVGFLEGGMAGALKWLEGALTYVSGVIKVFTSVIGGLVNIVGDLIRGDWTAAWGHAGEMVEGVMEGITMMVEGAVTAVIGLFEGLIGGVAGALQGFWDMTMTFFKSVYDTLVGHSIIPDLIRAIVAAFASLPGSLLSLAGSMWDAAVGLGNQLRDGFVGGIQGTLGAIGDLGGKVLEALKYLINQAIDSINNAIPDEIGFDVLGNWVGIDLPDNPIPHLAKGIRDFAGGLAVVGEEGPELVGLPKGSSVYPNSMLDNLAIALRSLPGSAFASNLSSQGLGTVNNYFNQTVNSNAGVSTVISDFALLKALAE